MTKDELKARYPRLYAEIFGRGVKAERRRIQAAELIAGAVAEQPPQINSPAIVAERSRASRQRVARVMDLRTQTARHLCGL
jgi:hypothetical protein